MGGNYAFLLLEKRWFAHAALQTTLIVLRYMNHSTSFKRWRSVYQQRLRKVWWVSLKTNKCYCLQNEIEVYRALLRPRIHFLGCTSSLWTPASSSITQCVLSEFWSDLTRAFWPVRICLLLIFQIITACDLLGVKWIYGDIAWQL